MNWDRRWDPCVAHYDHEVDEFLADYLLPRLRRAFLVQAPASIPGRLPL